MSRPSSPFCSRARLPASFFSRSVPRRATSAACFRSTTTTPSSSATITSPGLMLTPAHTTGTLTEPTLALTVPLAEIARDHTGNFISLISAASRQPMSRITPFAPSALSEVASSSPKPPSLFSLEQATTRMSPFFSTSQATWIIQLSPGWQSAVIALPAMRAPRQTGRMYGCISPIRPCASCTVATPWRPRLSIAPASARWMLRTTVPLMSSRSGDPAGFQELLERLAAESRNHLGIRHALGARELLQAEKARAVVLQRLPVEAPHHVLFLLGEAFHRLLRVGVEEIAERGLRQAVQEAVEPQSARAALEVEDVLRHSKSATAIAVVIGR